MHIKFSTMHWHLLAVLGCVALATDPQPAGNPLSYEALRDNAGRFTRRLISSSCLESPESKEVAHVFVASLQHPSVTEDNFVEMLNTFTAAIASEEQYRVPRGASVGVEQALVGLQARLATLQQRVGLGTSLARSSFATGFACCIASLSSLGLCGPLYIPIPYTGGVCLSQTCCAVSCVSSVVSSAEGRELLDGHRVERALLYNARDDRRTVYGAGHNTGREGIRIQGYNQRVADVVDQSERYRQARDRTPLHPLPQDEALGVTASLGHTLELLPSVLTYELLEKDPNQYGNLLANIVIRYNGGHSHGVLVIVRHIMKYLTQDLVNEGNYKNTLQSLVNRLLSNSMLRYAFDSLECTPCVVTDQPTGDEDLPLLPYQLQFDDQVSYLLAEDAADTKCGTMATLVGLTVMLSYAALIPPFDPYIYQCVPCMSMIGGELGLGTVLCSALSSFFVRSGAVEDVLEDWDAVEEHRAQRRPHTE